MRNILLLGLVGALLTGCEKFGVEPNAQSVELTVMQNALDRCESLTWQDAGLTWADDQTLQSGLSLSVWDGKNRQDVTLSGKAVVLSKAGTYKLSNRTGVSLSSLNSVFTCARTGEKLDAGFTFPGLQDYLHEWVSGTLNVENGQLKVQWLPSSPPA